ncbi:MAG: hypothetical protein HQM10_09120 [Candidatus Riflebacteria bacterium]|nr:hypothetical protein [Candidatus Riflebacteria bacterium]
MNVFFEIGKKQISIIPFLIFLQLLWVSTSTVAAVQPGETLIWGTEFDSLDKSDWWATRGSWGDKFGEGKPYDATGILVKNGEVTLLAERTNEVGVLYSRPIAVPRGAVIFLRRRVKIHAANRKFGGTLEVFACESGVPSPAKPDFNQRLFAITYQNMDYETDLNCIALLTGSNVPNGPGKYQGGQAPLIPGRWDEWLEEEVSYDTGSGEVTYRLPGIEPLRAKGVPLAQPCIKLLQHPYGWGTGHYVTMDFIEIFIRDGKAPDSPPIADNRPGKDLRPPVGDSPSLPVSDDPAIRDEQAGIDRLLKGMTAALEAKDAGRAAAFFRPKDQEDIREAFIKHPEDMAKSLPILTAAQPESVSGTFAPMSDGTNRLATLVSKTTDGIVRLSLVKINENWLFSLKGVKK